MIIKLIKCLIVVIVLSGCKYHENMSNGDIVFQISSNYSQKNLKFDYGTINSDGSMLQYTKLKKSYFDLKFVERDGILFSPAWVKEKKLVFFKAPTKQASSLSNLYTVSDNGSPQEINNFWGYGKIAPVANSQKVIVQQSVGTPRKNEKNLIELVDVQIQNSSQILYTSTITDTQLIIGTNALHEESLVFTLQSKEHDELVLFNVYTKHHMVLLQITDGEIFYPAISPDGQWVGYTLYDGIYIINTNTKQYTKLLDISLTHEVFDRERWVDWPPAMSWSPDGQWVVYHRCTLMGGMCENISDYAVFKMDLKTKKETKLIEGGINPYWYIGS